MWAAIWDCNQDGATRDRANRRCTSARKAICICARCWCRERITFSVRLGRISDLRRWGLKLAERGGKNGKKRAVIATARKLAVLLHRLWVRGEAYEPLRNSQQREHCRPQPKVKIFYERRSKKKEQKPKRRVPVTASIAWPTSIRGMDERSKIRWQHRLRPVVIDCNPDSQQLTMDRQRACNRIHRARAIPTP